MNVRNVAFGLSAVGALFTCRVVLGIAIDLQLSEVDFTRQHVYLSTANGTSYTDAIFFTLPALSIAPGDPVDVRANLLQPVVMENYFAGAPFSVFVELERGHPPSTFHQSLSTNLSLLGTENLAIGNTSHLAWTSVPNTFRQEALVSVAPTSDFGSIRALEWHYLAPSWTPAGGDVRFEMSFQIVYGSDAPFFDPGRNLLTFLPEPSVAAILLTLFPLMFVRYAWRWRIPRWHSANRHDAGCRGAGADRVALAITVT